MTCLLRKGIFVASQIKRKKNQFLNDHGYLLGAQFEIISLYLKPEEQFGQLNLAEELIVFVPTLISQNDLIPFHGSHSFYLYLGSHALVPSPISAKQMILKVS